MFKLMMKKDQEIYLDQILKVKKKKNYKTSQIGFQLQEQELNNL